MSNKLTITVSSGIHSGKTTIMELINDALISKGIRVNVSCPDGDFKQNSDQRMVWLEEAVEKVGVTVDLKEVHERFPIDFNRRQVSPHLFHIQTWRQAVPHLTGYISLSDIKRLAPEMFELVEFGLLFIAVPGTDLYSTVSLGDVPEGFEFVEEIIVSRGGAAVKERTFRLEVTKEQPDWLIEDGWTY